jgi:hypothetical protein
MKLPMPLKIIPQAVGYLGVYKVQSSLGKLKEREEVYRNASKASLDEGNFCSIGKQFPSPSCNHF